MTIDEKIENVKIRERCFNIGDYVVCEDVMPGGAYDEVVIEELYIGRIKQFYERKLNEDISVVDRLELENCYLLKRFVKSLKGELIDQNLFPEKIADKEFHVNDIKQKISEQGFVYLIESEM